MSDNDDNESDENEVDRFAVSADDDDNNDENAAWTRFFFILIRFYRCLKNDNKI